MAHGFLSYSPNNIGSSVVEQRLEKMLKEQLDKQTKKLSKFIKNKYDDLLFNLRTKSPRSPNPYRMSKEDSTPLANMLSGSAFQNSLSSGAINPDSVHGGSISVAEKFKGKRFNPTAAIPVEFADLGYVDERGDENFFPRRADIATLSGDDFGSRYGGQIVQAIDELKDVTSSLVEATDDQTDNQTKIAQSQKQQGEKLARKSKIAAETAGFSKDDFSNNIAFEALASGGRGLMNGRGIGGGGLMGGGLGMMGMGLGGKVAARKMLTNSIMRRGGSRAMRRTGIALGGRFSKGLGKKLGRKLGGKAIGKVAGGALGKSLGKKVPLLGLGLGALFAAQRAMSGDFVGAGLELASGGAAMFPGIGTAGSVGIDAALMARDMRGMADGGVLTEPTNVIAGEAGAEGFFPLEGSRGKKTFNMFGEGIIDAQRRNKGLFGKLQAEGFKEYYDKQNGLARFGDVFASGGFFENLKEVLGAITLPMGFKPFKFNSSEGDNINNNSSIKLENYGGGFGIKGFKVGRKNSGQDMRVNADGVFESKIGGVVTKIGEHKDLGQYVDIVNEERGVTERIADIAGVMPGIEVGASITPGMPVAKGNDAGIVHYEIRNGGNADAEKYKAKFGFGGTENPNEFLEGISNVDNSSSSVLNTLSEDTSTSNSGGTTIINNITQASPTNNSSNQGSDVALGASASEMGAHALFATMALRA